MIGPIRSVLFVPGIRQDRFAKAMGAGADAVVFDLEDSVEAAQKAKARSLVAEFLSTPGSEALRLVRLNPVHTADGEADLELFAGAAGFDGVLLPKVETVGAVELVARIFARHAPPTGPSGLIEYHSQQASERDLPAATTARPVPFQKGHSTSAIPPLLLLLETPRAILRAAEIAAADAPVAALLFGAEDLTAQLAVERTIDGEELLFARSQIVLAAAAVGADAIDAIVTDLNDLALLRRDGERARALGFRGKMAIHPRQVAVINEVFTPSAAEVDRARRLIDTYETARSAGEGVTKMDGRMVELPIVDRARRTLALAARCGAQ